MHICNVQSVSPTTNPHVTQTPILTELANLYETGCLIDTKIFCSELNWSASQAVEESPRISWCPGNSRARHTHTHTHKHKHTAATASGWWWCDKRAVTWSVFGARHNKPPRAKPPGKMAVSVREEEREEREGGREWQRCETDEKRCLFISL